MLKKVDEIQQLGTDNMDAAMKSFGAMSKGFQAIAAEIVDYSKSSMETHAAAMGKLLAAKSPEKAFEVQSEYVKTAYEGFVAQASKISGLYAELAKEACKPIEGVIGSKPFAS